MVLSLLLAMQLVVQDLNSNFEKLLIEVNRNRFDKALMQLFPVQQVIREKTGGKYPTLDAGMQARMREMDNTGAVLSTVALLKSQMDTNSFEEASVQAMLIGMGLSGLWGQVPAYQKLNFAKQDVEEAKPEMKELEMRKLGYAAVEAREWDTAKKTASDLLKSSLQKDYRGIDPGAQQHSALTIRGLAELRQGDLSSAEKSLVESMRVKGEMQMRSGGPSFRLAKELLAKGSKQAVDQFLVLVGDSVWKDSSKAATWRKELAAGRDLDFGSAAYTY